MTENTGIAQRPWSVAPYLIVDDVAATANFYRDTLGFHYPMLWGEPPRFTIVRRQGASIMLRQLEGSGFMKPNRSVDPEADAWDAYIWVDNVDALYEEFQKKGAKIVQAICDQEYGARNFDIEDCNGYRLCFGQDIST